MGKRTDEEEEEEQEGGSNGGGGYISTLFFLIFSFQKQLIELTVKNGSNNYKYINVSNVNGEKKLAEP